MSIPPKCLRLLLLTLLTSAMGTAVAIEYPKTRRVDQVDTYHGVEVADPYRWLEADVRESPEVADWVAEQEKLARHYLDAIPARKVFEERLTKLYNYERFSAPSVKKGKYFYFRNDGLQDQSVLYLADSPTAEGQVLLDPNGWSKDGTVALSAVASDDDAKYLAYAKSSAGSDWKTIHVLEIDTGKELDDVIEWVRFSGIEWNKEGTGFYYARYPEPEEGQQFQSVALNRKLYFHKLGTPQSEDVLIYERPDHPDWSFGATESFDGTVLVLEISRGTDHQNQVWLRDLADDKSEWQPLVENFDHEYSFVTKHGDDLYFLTDDDAPQKRLVAFKFGGGKNFREVIPERAATLVDVNHVGAMLFVDYLKNVHTEVELYSLDGDRIGEVDLPGIGSAGGFGGNPDSTETFYTFTSVIWPAVVCRFDLETQESEVIRVPSVDFKSNDYELSQVLYKSKDGTEIPMTIAHRKGLELDGNRPTLLYGYGGFAISITPSFSVNYAAWMEQGGVVAIANLRGGGEFGEEWHLAGKKSKKQNVFDDFIAAAEWLIENKYTSSKKIAVMGRSNGGLLVGAVMTQRPDLFGACLPGVGVLDMLRFHKFTAGQFWRTEYGSADNADEFETLRRYSPYHNIKADVSYPPTMITTADTDDRVVPMHSFKFAAELQRVQQGKAPILLRVETRAGHGAGTPVSKKIDEAADTWAFLAKVLEMDIDAPGGE